MTIQRPLFLSRLFTGVITVLLVLGFGVSGLALWSGSINLCRVADLFFDLSLVVTMVARGGSLLRPSPGTPKFCEHSARRSAPAARG